METSKQLANRFREVMLNGKWIANTNYKDQLSQVTWQQATQKVGNLNTLAALTYHINYYTAGIVNVFEGGALEIRDKYSFDRPPIESQADWEQLQSRIYSDAEKFASLVEKLSDDELRAGFVEEKYDNYFRNLLGMTEHCYYHLGQIVLLKKLIAQQA